MKRKKLLFSSSIVMLLCMIGCAGSNNFQVKNHYRLERVVYNIYDDQIRGILENEKKETSFKLGQYLEKKSFDKERKRIENIIKKMLILNLMKN